MPAAIAAIPFERDKQTAQYEDQAKQEIGRPVHNKTAISSVNI
jgi:hypothetical protein